MTIQQTQFEAYEDLKPTLCRRRESVLSVIAHHDRGLALFEIEILLRWPINCISGRVTELRKAGRIIDSTERRVNPATGRAGVVWIKNDHPVHPPRFGEDGGQLYFE